MFKRESDFWVIGAFLLGMLLGAGYTFWSALGYMKECLVWAY